LKGRGFSRATSALCFCHSEGLQGSPANPILVCWGGAPKNLGVVGAGLTDGGADAAKYQDPSPRARLALASRLLGMTVQGSAFTARLEATPFQSKPINNPGFYAYNCDSFRPTLVRWPALWNDDVRSCDWSLRRSLNTYHYCGQKLPANDSWGFDLDIHPECSKCSAARGSLTPRQFLGLCRRIATRRAREELCLATKIVFDTAAMAP